MRKVHQNSEGLLNNLKSHNSSDLATYLCKKTWPLAPSTSTSKSKLIRIADLYCGCGGLTLGAMQASFALSRQFEIALAIDISSKATGVYQTNFDKFSKRVLSDDLTKFATDSTFAKLNSRGKTLTKLVGKIDVLLAGPPCQGNSNLNNNSRGNDPRNDLYLAPSLFANELRANIVIIENVPGVVHGNSKVVQRSILKLQKDGYFCHELVVNLTTLGLPQSRKRHLLVASRIHSESQLKLRLNLMPKEKQVVCLSNFISDIEDEPSLFPSVFSMPGRPTSENLKRINYLFDHGLFDLPNSLRPPCHKNKPHSYVSMYGRLRSDAPSQTITSGFGSMGQGRFVHPTRRRTITPHEAARIQGFPDYFSFDEIKSITELRQMIGNAVAPKLSFEIVTRLLN